MDASVAASAIIRFILSCIGQFLTGLLTLGRALGGMSYILGAFRPVQSVEDGESLLLVECIHADHRAWDFGGPLLLLDSHGGLALIRSSSWSLLLESNRWRLRPHRAIQHLIRILVLRTFPGICSGSLLLCKAAAWAKEEVILLISFLFHLLLID